MNGQALNANLKGLKKKPGTAPPPDIGKNVRQAQNASNRVEMIYVNSQQPMLTKARSLSPFQPLVAHRRTQKYYLVVMLVEVTTVDQLVERLRKGKYRPATDVLTDSEWWACVGWYSCSHDPLQWPRLQVMTMISWLGIRKCP